MQPFPHSYTVDATASAAGDVSLSGERLPNLVSAPPMEFDGPGDRWSPETLAVGSVAGCFVLTFRSIAAVSKLPWTTLTCTASGTLDRVDRATQFTRFTVSASLEIPEGVKEDDAKRLLKRAEQACLITNSFKAPCRLDVDVRIAQPALL